MIRKSVKNTQCKKTYNVFLKNRKKTYSYHKKMYGKTRRIVVNLYYNKDSREEQKNEEKIMSSFIVRRHGSFYACRLRQQ